MLPFCDRRVIVTRKDTRLRKKNQLVGLPLPQPLAFNDAVPASQIMRFPDLRPLAGRLDDAFFLHPASVPAFIWRESLNQ